MMEYLDKLVVMYGKIYYQERMAEELSKKPPEPYKKVPELPQKPTSGGKGCAWIAFAVLALFVVISLFGQDFFGFFFWGVCGTFAFFTAIVAGDNEEKDAKKYARAKELAEGVENENDELRKLYPLYCHLMYDVAQEYLKAKQHNQDKVKTMCDVVGVPQKYRNYSNVCTLYRYYEMDSRISIEQACMKLEKEIQEAYYMTDPTDALKNMERVKMNQPIFAENVLKREDDVKRAVPEVQKYGLSVLPKDIGTFSGNAQEYKYKTVLNYVCGYDSGRYSTWWTVENSKF